MVDQKMRTEKRDRNLTGTRAFRNSKIAIARLIHFSKTDSKKTYTTPSSIMLPGLEWKIRLVRGWSGRLYKDISPGSAQLGSLDWNGYPLYGVRD